METRKKNHTNDTHVRLMNHPKYLEWILAGRGLVVLKKCLEPVTVAVITQWHDELKEKLKTLPSCQKGCTNQQIKKKAFEPPCEHCTGWLLAIKEQMDVHNLKMIKRWPNCNVQQWPTHPWQLSTPFMMPGSETCVTPQDSDVSGLLHLIINCKKFTEKYPDEDLLTLAAEVREKRNDIMHQPALEIDTVTRKEVIDLMTNFLKKFKDDTNDQLVEDRIRELQELKNLDVERLQIAEVVDYEENVWNNTLAVMDQTEIPEVQNVLNTLVKKFGEFSDILAKVNAHPRVISIQVNNIQVNVNIGSATSNGAGGNGCNQKVLMPSVDASPQGNHKNKLQEYCQRWGINPLPEYCDEPVDGGFRCRVTVAGNTYLSERVHTTKRNSHQDAAFQALKQLESNQSDPLETMADMMDALPLSEGDNPAGSQVDEDPISYLEDYCRNKGFNNPLCMSRPNNGYWIGMKVVVSMPYKDVKKKEREKLVAQRALSKLGKEVDISQAKNQLQEYTQGESAKVFGANPGHPVYEVEDRSEFRVTFLAVREAISATSELEAKKAAAREMIRIIC